MPNQSHNNQISHQPQIIPQQQTLDSLVEPKKTPFFKTSKFKFIAGAVIAFILAFGLAVTMMNKPPETKTPTTVSIDFWGMNVDEAVMQEIIDDFESKNPYIKVKYERQADSSYKDRLETRLKLGDSSVLPDIIEIDEAWIREFEGLANVKNADVNNKFSPILIKNNTVGSAQFGIPYKFNSLALAYNTKHLAEKGYTATDFNQLDWSSLKARAAILTQTQLTQIEKRPVLNFLRGGIAIGSPDTVENADKILQLLLIQNDAAIYDVLTEKFTINQKAIEIIDFYTKFASENIWDDSLGSDIEAFANEKVSMAIVKSEDIDEIKRLNPNLEFSTVLPAKISSVKNISFSTSLSVPASSPYYNQAMSFLKFLTEEENMTKLYESKSDNTFVPSNRDSLNKIPSDSEFAVFSDLSSTAERLNVPNNTEASAAIKGFLQTTYLRYYNGVKADRSENAFVLEPGKLESSLNNTLK